MIPLDLYVQPGRCNTHSGEIKKGSSNSNPVAGKRGSNQSSIYAVADPEKKIQILKKHREPKMRIDPGGRHGRLINARAPGNREGGKAQVITGSKGPQNNKVVTVEKAAEMVYRFMSQFGRRLDIKSSLVPTVSAGSRLIR